MAKIPYLQLLRSSTSRREMNALSAQLPYSDGNRDIERCRGLNAVVVATVASWPDAHKHPAWVRFTLTESLIDTLVRLYDLCRYGHVGRCSNVAPGEYAPDTSGRPWPIAINLLVMEGGGFYMQAVDGLTHDTFESERFQFRSFFEYVAIGCRYFSSNTSALAVLPDERDCATRAVSAG